MKKSTPASRAPGVESVGIICAVIASTSAASALVRNVGVRVSPDEFTAAAWWAAAAISDQSSPRQDAPIVPPTILRNDRRAFLSSFGVFTPYDYLTGCRRQAFSCLPASRTGLGIYSVAHNAARLKSSTRRCQISGQAGGAELEERAACGFMRGKLPWIRPERISAGRRSARFRTACRTTSTNGVR